MCNLLLRFVLGLPELWTARTAGSRNDQPLINLPQQNPEAVIPVEHSHSSVLFLNAERDGGASRSGECLDSVRHPSPLTGDFGQHFRGFKVSLFPSALANVVSGCAQEPKNLYRNGL